MRWLEENLINVIEILILIFVVKNYYKLLPLICSIDSFGLIPEKRDWNYDKCRFIDKDSIPMFYF